MVASMRPSGITDGITIDDAVQNLQHHDASMRPSGITDGIAEMTTLRMAALRPLQ